MCRKNEKTLGAGKTNYHLKEEISARRLFKNNLTNLNSYNKLFKNFSSRIIHGHTPPQMYIIFFDCCKNNAGLLSKYKIFFVSKFLAIIIFDFSFIIKFADKGLDQKTVSRINLSQKFEQYLEAVLIKLHYSSE